MSQEQITPTPPTSSPEEALPDPDKKFRRRALMIVFFVVFIDLLGFGIVLPLLPRFADTYLIKLFGSKNTPMGGLTLGLLMASFSAMQFIFAPIWGRISDRVGRRPILLLGLIGSVIFYSLLGFASGFGATDAGLAIALLFVARIGAGVAGATIATAQAVIADCTPPDKRKHGMALIGAAFGIGFTFGPLIGFAAMSFSGDHPESVGYVAAGTSFIALLLGIRLLPETRKFDAPSGAKRKWIDWGSMRRVLSNPALSPVLLTFFLATLGFASFEVTLALLNRDALGIGNENNFLIFAYVGFILMLTQGFLYRKLAKKMTEATLMTIGIVLMGIGVISLGGVSYSAHTNLMTKGQLYPCLFISLAVSVVGFAFLTPSAQALISRRSDDNVQGETLGVNQSASALARILGPIFGLVLYKLTETHLLPYVFGGGLVLLMLPLIPRIKRGDADANEVTDAPTE